MTKYKCSRCGHIWGRTLCIHHFVHCPKCGNTMREEVSRVIVVSKEETKNGK